MRKPISLIFTLICFVFIYNACQPQKDESADQNIPKGDTHEASEVISVDTTQVPIEEKTTTSEAYELPPARRQWQQKDPKALKWISLSPGLDYAYVEAPIACNIGDSHFSILRADQARYEANIYSSKLIDHQNHTAPQWSKKHKLIALVNAGMYQMDHETNVGYMKANGKINQSRFNKDKAFFVSGPIEDSLPAWQLVDRDCQDWENILKKYTNATQSIRMLNCGRGNTWGQQAKYWSMVAIGTDSKGRLLFLFCRSPYSVHDFIDMAKALPIDLQRCMYLEGGPEASFYVQTADTTIGKMGSYETGFFESDDNSEFWSIPNVIGLRSRDNNP